MHIVIWGDEANCISPEERMAVDKVLGIDHCVILPGPINGEQNILPGTVDTAQARELAQRFPDHFSWFCNVEPDFIYPLGQMLDYALLSGQLDEAVYKKICRENAIRVLNMDLET